MTLSIREIQDAVCRRYGVTTLDLVSNRRSRAIILPRHVAMWMARYLTRHSLPEIGMAFGKRDHSTVAYAIDRINALVRNDRMQAAIIWALVESMDCEESVDFRRAVLRIVA